MTRASASPAPTSRRRRRRSSQIRRAPSTPTASDVTAADNGKLHVIPVAIGAITVIVNLPETPGDCTVGTEVFDSPPRPKHDPPEDPQRAARRRVGGPTSHVGRADPDDDRHLRRRRLRQRADQARGPPGLLGLDVRVQGLPEHDRPGALAGPRQHGVAERTRRHRGRPRRRLGRRLAALHGGGTDGSISYLVARRRALGTRHSSRDAGRDRTTTRSGCRSSARPAGHLRRSQAGARTASQTTAAERARTAPRR